LATAATTAIRLSILPPRATTAVRLSILPPRARESWRQANKRRSFGVQLNGQTGNAQRLTTAKHRAPQRRSGGHVMGPSPTLRLPRYPLKVACNLRKPRIRTTLRVFRSNPGGLRGVFAEQNAFLKDLRQM
jgi:hypothetical protein